MDRGDQIVRGVTMIACMTVLTAIAHIAAGFTMNQSIFLGVMFTNVAFQDTL